MALLFLPVIAAEEEPPQAMKTIFLSANASISVGTCWFRSEALPNWPWPPCPHESTLPSSVITPKFQVKIV